MTKRTILAVDDNPLALAAIQIALATSEYALVTADSGEEALAQVPEVHPDLLLLDVFMPGMNGLEVCRRLRMDPATEHLPIVLLSAHDGMKEKLAGFRAGADDYLVKGSDLTNLAYRLRMVLSLRGPRGPVA